MLIFTRFVSVYTSGIDGGLVPDPGAPEQRLLWALVGGVLLMALVFKLKAKWAVVRS